MLMDTDDVAIHQDILQRLPVRDFFIPVYDSYDYNGMFVHVEFDEKKTTAFGIVLVGPTKGSHDDFTFLTLPAWAKENQSLTEATRSTKEYLEKAAGQRQVNGISVPAVMEAVLRSLTAAHLMSGWQSCAPTILPARTLMSA